MTGKRVMALGLTLGCIFTAGCGAAVPAQNTQSDLVPEQSTESIVIAKPETTVTETDGQDTKPEESETKTEEQQEQPMEDIGSDARKKADKDAIIYADSYVFDKLTFDGGTALAFDVTIEAETAKSASGVTGKKDSVCSGGSYVDITDNKDFCVTVTVPASQFYRISICHKAGSHKENPFLFNGTKVCDVISEDGAWVVSEYDGIYLTEGENEITLGEGWSWFSLDYIRVENGTTIGEEFYRTDGKLLSNPYANLKTQNIYQYLQAIYGKRTLAGQCTDYGHNTETDALYKGLGKYPALRTFDFIFDSFSFCSGKPGAKDMALAKEWSEMGGLVAFDWHWYAPSGKCEFYTEKTDFNIPKAKPSADLDLAQTDLEKIRAMYKAGDVSIETLALFTDLDNIAGLLQELEDADVTVLWRPLHEASGGWFWWGATGAEDYIWLWQTMYERYTYFHELDNLIWVWNAQDPAWYPGDDYCDIAALDVYGPAHDYGVSATALQNVNTWVKGKKMITMSECAAMPDPDLIVRDNAYWLWFAVWNWDYIVVNGKPELSEQFTELEMMKKVYNSEVIITLDELPEF